VRFPDEDYHTFGEFVRRRYPGLKPDLVIALEDAAIEFVTRYQASLFPSTPIIFYTRNAAAQRLPNSTGVIEPIDFAKTIELVGALQPETNQVFVVSGASVRDKWYEAMARAQFQALASRFTFTYLSGLPIPELEQRLAALPPRSIVYPLLVSRSASDQFFKPQDINERIPLIANRPTYAWHEQHLGAGVVGGSLLQLEPGLTMVADRAIRVLSGEAPGSIDVARPHRQIDRIDWRQLHRWGISERRVPPGFVVAFREATFWQRYWVYLLAAGVIVFAQTVLIGGLLIQARRRHQAEQELRQSQIELTRSYERVRDVGGRLLTAQEAERSRIALELHDDVGQQIVLLAMDLDKPNGADHARQRLAGLACSLRELSHRLHPSNLQILGLVRSLESLQREHQQSGMPVRFVHDDIPEPLSPALTLCLFRVVQEAVHNAAKHSDASAVSVELRHDRSELTLTIADDGVGFDVETAWGKGLGLISIQERVEANGGTMAVQSTPGSGTEFMIRVPIASADPEPSN
jgi:two-component sensor histidine kinase